MNRTRIFVIAVGLCVLSLAALGEVTTVTLKEEATAKGVRLHLGQVADIQGAKMEEYAAIQLGAAPLASQSRIVQVGIVNAAIVKAGFAPDLFTLMGAKAVKVTTPAMSLTAEMVELSLRDHIEMNMPWDPEKTIVEVTVPPLSMIVPEGDLTFEWRPASGFRYLGNGGVKGEVKVDGRVCKNLFCRANIETYGDILIAKGQIPKGQVIGPDDIAVEERALSGAGTDQTLTVEDVVGYAARRALFPGQVINKSYLADEMVVKRNQLVQVEVRNGSFILRSEAKAMADAGAGQTVRLMNLASKSEYMGVVRPDGVVEAL